MTEEINDTGAATADDSRPEGDGAAVRAPRVNLVTAAPAIADGIERPLDPRSVALGRTIGWIVTASISIGSLFGLAIALVVQSPGLWAVTATALAWAGGSAALGWWLHRWPEIEHRHASYRVDELGIEIRGGVVWRRVVNVPRSRVQHTDVSQGPLARGYGLGTLSIYTAGTDHARVDLPGLDHATALAIRDHLLPREGADAV